MVLAALADRLLGHAEHHAGLFVLGVGGRAGLVHFLQPTRAVVTHAGHDDAGGVRPANLAHERNSMSTDGR